MSSWWLAGAVLALVSALAVFARGDRRGRLFYLATLCACCVALGWSGSRQPAAVVVSEEGRPVEVLGNGYVGSDACLPCHPGESATWRASYHRTMTQLATPTAIRGDFDDVRLELGGEAYHMKRRGEAYFINGEQVVMATGSHHMQAYWVSDGAGRRVRLVQLVYLFDEERWIARRDAFVQPPGARERIDYWNDNCIGCHATDGRPRLGPEADTHASEFGIACEACHGPGAEHVAVNRSPVRRYTAYFDRDGGDPTIVNPARLSAVRGSHVCAQCHANSVFPDDEARQAFYHGEGDRYRPGDDVNVSDAILLGPDDPRGPTADSAELEAYLRDDIFWPDGPSRGSGREFNAMYFSPCFTSQEGHDTVSCLSCHQMHRRPDDPRPLEAWTDDQLQPEMDGDMACLQCHRNDLKGDIAEHTRHAPGSTGSRCQNCHMPFTTWGLLKAIRSHHISAPSVANELETGRPNACNLCHLDKSLGWTAEYLRRWNDTPVPQLTEEQRVVAASIGWLLTGDARQRAIAAWHSGWAPARAASGDDWLAPFLAPLLADPYAVVRFTATRSLRTLPGFGEFEADAFAAPAAREQTALRAWTAWGRIGTRRSDRSLLIGPGGLDAGGLSRMLERRDDRPVGVVE